MKNRLVTYALAWMWCAIGIHAGVTVHFQSVGDVPRFVGEDDRSSVELSFLSLGVVENQGENTGSSSAILSQWRPVGTTTMSRFFPDGGVTATFYVDETGLEGKDLALLVGRTMDGAPLEDDYSNLDLVGLFKGGAERWQFADTQAAPPNDVKIWTSDGIRQGVIGEVLSNRLSLVRFNPAVDDEPISVSSSIEAVAAMAVFKATIELSGVWGKDDFFVEVCKDLAVGDWQPMGEVRIESHSEGERTKVIFELFRMERSSEFFRLRRHVE